jgi:hypothetical protein
MSKERSGLDRLLSLAACGVIYGFFFAGCADIIRLLARLLTRPPRYRPKYRDDGRPDYDKDPRFTPRQRDFLNRMWDESTDRKRRARH